MKWWNPLAWSLPTKLTIGLLIAVSLAIVIVGLVANSSFQSYNEQSVRAYLRERGVQQVEQINGNLRAAADDLNRFVDNNGNQFLLEAVLSENPSEASRQAIRSRLTEFLGQTPRIAQVWVIKPEGNPIVDVRRSGDSLPITSTIVESTRNQVSTAFDLGTQRALSIVPLELDTGAPVTLSAAITLNPSDSLQGFVIALLDQNQVFLEALRSNDGPFATYAYLVTSDTTYRVMALPEVINTVRRTVAGSSVALLAFRGQADIAAYNLGQEQEQALAYYAPIQNPYDRRVPSFAFVTEYNLTTAANPLTNLFDASRLFPLVVGLVVIFGLLAVLLNQIINPPVKHLTQAIESMTRGDFTAPVPSAGRGDEIGEMGAAFLDMRAQVRLLLDNLEARVAARSRDFAATQEISRFAATQRSLQTLLDQVVQLIVEQFSGIYHAQVFLLDDAETYGVLRSSTGEAGKMLLARGHKLAVGSLSMIGQVLEQGQTLVSRDTAASDIHRKNDLLPETRAELAIPLRLGNRVIGALDVQSKQREAFSADEIQVLETMADQVAVAIENARLYQESVRRLEEIDAINRRSTQRAWQEYLNGRRANQLTSEAGQAFSTDTSGLRQSALARGQIVTGAVTANQTVPLAVPIMLRGQTIGAVEWEFPAGDLDDNRLQLAQELANRLAVSLENARLFEERQRAAERERVVNNIAARLTPQTDINDILQTAVREIGQALRSPQVSIRLHQIDTAPAHSANGSNGSAHPAAAAQPVMENQQP
jgi:GAF domain-containing protein/HAMP domain-containing protein